MTRYQKISLGLWLAVIVVIFLSMMEAHGQAWEIDRVSGYGYRGEVDVKGYALIQEDSTIIINTDYGRLTFKYIKTFDIGATQFYDLECLSASWHLWYDRNMNTLTLNRRYRGRPEQTIRYIFKKKI